MTNLAIYRQSLLIHTEELPRNTESRTELRSIAQTWWKFCCEQLPFVQDMKIRANLDACRVVSLVVLSREGSSFDRLSPIIGYDCTLTIRGFALVKPLDLPRPKPGEKMHRKSKLLPRNTTRYLHLNFMSSDPHDLIQDCRLGVGARLMHFLFTKCVQENLKGVFVEPTHSFDFFSRYGFVDATHANVDTGSDIAFMIWKPPVLNVPLSLADKPNDSAPQSMLGVQSFC